MSDSTTQQPPAFPALDDLAELPVSSWEELVLLGSQNILRIVPILRRRERYYSTGIEEVNRWLSDLANFRQIASESETLTDLTFIPTGDNFAPEAPIDRESLLRKPGSTTFSACGWCKHGVGRNLGHFNLRPSCSFLPQESLNINSSCLLMAEKLEQAKDQLRTDLDLYKSRRRSIQSAIKWLQKMQPAPSPPHPLLCSLRHKSYVSHGDTVLAYCLRHTNYSGFWIRGVVYNNPQDNEENVRVGTSQKVTNDSELFGYGICSHVRSPFILTEADFNSLVLEALEESEFFRLWMTTLENDDERIPFENSLRQRLIVDTSNATG